MQVTVINNYTTQFLLLNLNRIQILQSSQTAYCFIYTDTYIIHDVGTINK